MQAVDEFRHTIEQAGLTAPDAIIPDGKLHRFASNGDRDDDAGWYVLFADGIPAGSFGCWRAGLMQKWCAKSDVTMSPTERVAHRRRVAELQRIRQEEEKQAHEVAAQRAQTIWDGATPAPADHPYLQCKGIQPHGVRVDDGHQLIVPVVIGDAIRSLQFISPDPTVPKKFLYGGASKDGYFFLGEQQDDQPVLVCEGFATAASLHEATGALTVVAFSAGNVGSVAAQARQQFPTATILICGDNDIHDDGRPNTGLLAATAAAKAIDGLLAIPELDGKKCDFNDLHRQCGLPVVKAATETALRGDQEIEVLSTTAGTMGPTATIPTMTTDAPEEMPDDAPPPGPDTTTAAAPETDARTRCTDVGNGELFARQHRETVRYCYRMKQWFVWDGQRWNPDDGGGMTLLAKQTALSLYARAAQESDESRRKALAKWAAESETERRLKSMVSLAQSEPGIAIAVDRLDADPLLLTVLNGTLDLRTGTLRPARREDFITKLAPVEYQPEAACPEFDRMLTRLFGLGSVMRDYLQRIFGYALTGVTTEQCFFLCFGTGANGKSTLLRTILDLLGEYAATTRPETFLVKRGDGIPNDVAALAGARFVVVLESEQGTRLAEGLVKGMTGGDKLSARFLNKEFFSFVPQLKLFLGTNHKPTIRGTDHGMWRRVRSVPFAVVIPEAEQDKQLPDRLRTEYAGILAWLIQGCLAWQRDGLGEPLEILAATAAYRAEQDVLGVFLKERCVLDPTAKSTKKDLYDDYTAWCEASGERHRLTMREFGQVVRERGVVDAKVGNAKGCVGLRLRTPLDADPDDDELAATSAQEESDVNLDA